MSHLEPDPRLATGALNGREDHAPGDEPEGSAGHWVRNANRGLGFSVLLTAAAFYLAGSDIIYGPALPVALVVLAVAQLKRICIRFRFTWPHSPAGLRSHVRPGPPSRSKADRNPL